MKLLREEVLFGEHMFSPDQYDLFRKLLLAAKAIAARHGETPRSGGYFCVTRAYDGYPRHFSRWGVVPPSHDEKYRRYGMEKPGRLAAHPEHVASSQSRNEVLCQFGGAIRTDLGDKDLYSFSGFPEPIDEPMMMAFAVMTGRLTLGGAMRIAELTSSVPRWEEFRSAVPLLAAA